jgi:hypothetical protein
MSRNEREFGGLTVSQIVLALVPIVLVVVVVAALMRPNYIQDQRALVNACINKLRLIDGAERQWATEHQKQSTDTPAGSDIQPYMTGELPCCPNDGKQTFNTSYSLNNVGTKPVCRIMPTDHILR